MKLRLLILMFAATTVSAAVDTITVNGAQISGNVVLSLALGASVTPTNAPGVFLWQQNLGSTINSTIYANAVASDYNESSIVGGGFQGQIIVGPVTYTNLALFDSFLAKFTSAGVYSWSKRFTNCVIQTATTDPGGSIIISGTFNGNTYFGGSVLASTNQDVFLATFGPDGSHQWSSGYGGTGTETSMSIAIDSNTNIFMGGYFSGTLNFGGGNTNATGSDDIFLAKFTRIGAFTRVKCYGGAGQDLGWKIAVNSSGDPVVTGSFTASTDFGGTVMVPTGPSDIFIAKYSGATGNLSWCSHYGAAGVASNARGQGIDYDSGGNVWVTGYFSGIVNFGGGNLTSQGGGDIFLAKYNGSGVYQYAQSFGSANGDIGISLSVDSVDNVIIVCNTPGGINMGTGFLIGSGRAMVVAKYNSSGVCQWSRRSVSSAGNADAVNITDTPSGDLLTTALYQFTVAFGGPTVTGGFGATLGILIKYAK